MNQSPQMNPCLVRRIDRQSPVLIELGHNDEALRYFGYLTTSNYPEAFHISMHEDSALLDVLRLKRQLSVNILFNDGQLFGGSLSIEHDGVLVHVGAVLERSDPSLDRIWPST